MIIAAARGGELRELCVEGEKQTPFAISGLLPYWVNVDKWSADYEAPWQSKVLAFTILLAHASRVVGETRDGGALTSLEVQSLRSQIPTDWDVGRFEHCLSWVEQDAELAQRVADAWSAVIQRGKADHIKCYCVKCSNRSLPFHFQIYVKSLSGTSSTHDLTLLDTVQSLKRKIQEEDGSLPDSYRLIVNGYQLRVGLLGDNKIEGTCTVHHVHR